MLFIAFERTHRFEHNIEIFCQHKKNVGHDAKIDRCRPCTTLQINDEREFL